MRSYAYYCMMDYFTHEVTATMTKTPMYAIPVLGENYGISILEQIHRYKNNVNDVIVHMYLLLHMFFTCV